MPVDAKALQETRDLPGVERKSASEIGVVHPVDVVLPTQQDLEDALVVGAEEVETLVGSPVARQRPIAPRGDVTRLEVMRSRGARRRTTARPSGLSAASGARRAGEWRAPRKVDHPSFVSAFDPGRPAGSGWPRCVRCRARWWRAWPCPPACRKTRITPLPGDGSSAPRQDLRRPGRARRAFARGGPRSPSSRTTAGRGPSRCRDPHGSACEPRLARLPRHGDDERSACRR